MKRLFLKYSTVVTDAGHQPGLLCGVTKALLAHGADVNARMRNNLTPALDWATARRLRLPPVVVVGPETPIKP